MSNVRDFGAAGDGKTDDTDAILHALANGDGTLEFPRGDFVISRTIPVHVAKTGRFAMAGSHGTAKILMTGAGPAFHLLGTHVLNADPKGFKPEVWARERMPTVLNIEVEGRHESASGFLVDGTMQVTFEGVLLRELLHGIHVHRRARNVLISHCHIYHNRGIGVFFDNLNLHQAIITGSHISYCKRGGIKIIGSEIRNLQITGNDIEYNYDLEAKESADILIDSSADNSSVREGTIVSNTIQAKYSPGGANVRIIGHNAKVNHKAGMFTVSNNLIGSQETNIHLVACRGMVVGGNVVYSGHHRNLMVEGSRNIVVSGNSFDHNPDYEAKELCTGIRLDNSVDVVLSGSLVHDCQTGQHTVANAKPLVREALVEIVGCKRVTVNGCEILDGTPYGLLLKDSSDVSVTGCMLLESREEKKTVAMISAQGTGSGNYISNNRLGKGTQGSVQAVEAAGVTASNNLEA